MAYTALVIWSPASSRAEELARWKVPKSEDRLRLILSHCRERERDREREWWRPRCNSQSLCAALKCSIYPIASPVGQIYSGSSSWYSTIHTLTTVHTTSCVAGLTTFWARVISSCASLRLLSTCSLSQKHDSCSRPCEGVRGEERRRAVT